MKRGRSKRTASKILPGPAGPADTSFPARRATRLIRRPAGTKTYAITGPYVVEEVHLQCHGHGPLPLGASM